MSWNKNQWGGFIAELQGQGLTPEEIQARIDQKKQELATGKQMGVAGEAATVAPDDVAAATGLASGTSLSESPSLAAPIAQPVQQKSNQIKKADLSSMGLEEQAKVLYANKINSPFFTSLDDIQKGKITREQVTEAAYKRGQYKSKNYDTAYADYISNYEETLPISQKYLRETGIDPFAPEIDQPTATALGQTAVDNSIYNLGPNVNLEDDETLQNISNNSIQEIVNNDKYLQGSLIPNVIKTIVLPKVDMQKKILAEKYNLNSANFNIEDYEKANEELNNFFNETISTELTSNNTYNNRVNTIKKAVNNEVQKNLTQAGRDRLGLDEKTSLGETLEGALKGIGNTFRSSLVATTTETSLSNQNKIETYERLLATGEMDENSFITMGGTVSAKTGAMIGGKKVKVREAIKLLQKDNIRIKDENLGRLKEYYDTQGDLTFYKDSLQDIENSNTFEEFIGKVVKNTPNLIVEQLPQLGLALSGVGVFAQELGPAYFDTIYAQMDKDGVEHSEENFLKYLENGKGDFAIASSSAIFQQALESIGGGTIANAIYKNIGKKHIASIMKLGVKEWAQKGGYKALVAGGKKSALTEALTETFQTAVNQLAKGISIQDAGKYFNADEIMKSGALGGYIGFLLPFGGNLAKQSATDIKGAAARINALTNKDASINILDKLRKDIQLDIDNNVISQEEGQTKLDAVTDVINADLKIRKEVTGKDKVKAIELQVEKQQIENEIERLDEDVDKSDLETRKGEIISELNEIQKKTLGKLSTAGAKKIAKKEGVIWKSFKTTKKGGVVTTATQKIEEFIAKENEKGENIDISKSGDFGFIIQNNDTGKQTVVLNEEVNEEYGVVTTAAHELLHAVLKKTFTSAEIQTKIGLELAKEMDKMTLTGGVGLMGRMDPAGGFKSEFARRWEQYHEQYRDKEKEGKTVTASEKGNAFEEGMNLLSEGLLSGEIVYNETTFTKIGDFIRQALSQMGIKARFDTGRDVFNFVRDYNKSLVKGELTTGQQKVMAEGAGGTLVSYAKSQEGITEMGLRDTEVKPSATTQEAISFNDLTIEDMLKQYDYTYQYSDDRKNFDRGRRQEEIINNKIKELGGWTQELVNTWNKSAPKDMEMDYTEVKSSLKIPEISKENKEIAAKNKELMAIIKDPILNETIENSKDKVEKGIANKKIQDAKGDLYMNNVGLINAAVNEVFNPSKGQRVTREELVNDANKYFTELIKTFTPSKGEWGAYAKPLIKLKLNESIARQTESFKDKKTGEWKMPSKEDVTEKQVEGKITTQPKFELEKEKVKKRLLTKKLDFDKEAIEGEFKADKDGKKVPKTFADVFVDAVAKTFGTKLPAVTNKNFVKEFSKSNIAQLMPFVRSFTKIDRKNKIDKFKPFIIKHFKPILDQLPASVINKKYAMLRKPVLKETGQQKRESTAEGKGEFEYLGMDRKDFVDYFTNKNPDVIATVAGKITVKDINGDEKTYRIVKPKKGKPLGGNEIDGTLLVSKRLGDEITVNGQQVELTNIEIASNTLSDRRTSLLETIINELSADAALEVVKDKTIMQKFKDIQEIEGQVVPENFIDRIVKELDRGLDNLNKLDVKSSLKFESSKLALNTIKNSIKSGNGLIQARGNAIRAVQKEYGYEGINADIAESYKENIVITKSSMKMHDKGISNTAKMIYYADTTGQLGIKENIGDVYRNPDERNNTIKVIETKVIPELNKKWGPKKAGLLMWQFGRATFASHETMPEESTTRKKDKFVLFRATEGYSKWWKEQFIEEFPEFKNYSSTKINNIIKEKLGDYKKERGAGSRLSEEAKGVNKKGGRKFNHQVDKKRAADAMELYSAIMEIASINARESGTLKSKKALAMIAKILTEQSNSLGKLAAPVLYEMENITEYKGDIIGEHLTPAAYLNFMMIEHYYRDNKNIDIEKIKSDYSVAFIPKDLATLINRAGSKGGNLKNIQHESYEDGKGHPTVRLFNDDVLEVTKGTKFENFKLLGLNFDLLKNPEQKIYTHEGTEVKSSLKPKDLGKEFNQMLEESKGIEAGKEYSEAQGRNIGRKANKLKIFVPYSAEDFLGLLYRFAGQGKQGDAHLKWIKDNISTPLTESFIRFEVAQQSANIYLEEAKKLAAESGIDFTKEAIDGYTVDQVIRIHIWSNSGYNLEKLIGMKDDQVKRINTHVRQNFDIKAFESAIKDAYVNNDRIYPPPKDRTWISGTITTDLLNFTNSTTRGEAFKSFFDNIDSIFGSFDKNKGKLSGANLNKIKAVYGTKFVKALESSLYRIHTGRNRSYQLDQQGDSILNWTNNAIGNIMFFNTRSAILQTLSNVNFTNWHDNNPIEVAKAWKNTGQFAKDFTYIFNSDYLKSRRSGLKTDINEQEIATAVNSTNKVEAMLATILKKGFLPTQMADSFAIALGGASFYRNRTNKYKNDGMSQEEAEAQAFKDFREISEESQQSSRPDKISMEQAGFAGRLILAFQNTPMQYNRLAKKAMLDLINRRGDAKTNVSKVIWYLGVQNAVFYASQQALFSIMFDAPETDDEEKREKQRYFNLANGMADSVIRGSGVYGALISTSKNLIIEILKEDTTEEKVVKALSAISPPINKKVRQVYSISKKFIYKQELKKMKELGLDSRNPAIVAGAEALSFGINLPADRALKKINNLRYAFEEETEWWQSVALALGWSPYDVNIDEFKKEPTIKLKGMKTPRKIKKRTVKKRKIG